jgi:hypothetical protein
MNGWMQILRGGGAGSNLLYIEKAGKKWLEERPLLDTNLAALMFYH